MDYESPLLNAIYRAALHRTMYYGTRYLRALHEVIEALRDFENMQPEEVLEITRIEEAHWEYCRKMREAGLEP